MRALGTPCVASWNLGAAKGILGPEIGSDLRTEMRRGSWRHGSSEVKVEGRAGGKGSASSYEIVGGSHGRR